jgi:hypothetical protein
MADCEQCGNVIKDADSAIHNGEHWFCTHRCLGAWHSAQSGNVPA